MLMHFYGRVIYFLGFPRYGHPGFPGRAVVERSERCVGHLARRLFLLQYFQLDVQFIIFNVLLLRCNSEQLPFHI